MKPAVKRRETMNRFQIPKVKESKGHNFWCVNILLKSESYSDTNSQISIGNFLYVISNKITNWYDNLIA